MINVTVWNEGVHEKLSNEVAGVYPAGIHGCIKNFLISHLTILFIIYSFFKAIY